MADFLYRWPSFISSINDPISGKDDPVQMSSIAFICTSSVNQNDGNKNIVVVCGMLNYEDYVGYHNAKVVCLRKK